MRPLLFVNWRRLNTRFTALMWIVACAMALVVLYHVSDGARGAAVARAPWHGAVTHVSLQHVKTIP